MHYLSLSPEERTDSCAYNIDVHLLCYCQAAVRLYTMFRKDWEAAREAKQSANNRFKKKKKANVDKLEPSRLEKTKLALKSIGSRNLYCPSDSDED